MSGKWLVVLEAVVEAETVGEAREKAIGPFGNFQNCRIKRLEYRRLKPKSEVKTLG